MKQIYFLIFAYLFNLFKGDILWNDPLNITTNWNIAGSGTVNALSSEGEAVCPFGDTYCVQISNSVVMTLKNPISINVSNYDNMSLRFSSKVTNFKGQSFCKIESIDDNSNIVGVVSYDNTIPIDPYQEITTFNLSRSNITSLENIRISSSGNTQICSFNDFIISGDLNVPDISVYSWSHYCTSCGPDTHPDNVLDGNLSTYWNGRGDAYSNYNLARWIVFKFVDQVKVDGFAVYNHGEFAYLEVRDFALQCSDSPNGPWRTAGGGATAAGTGWQWFSMAPTMYPYQYWRWFIVNTHYRYSDRASSNNNRLGGTLVGEVKFNYTISDGDFEPTANPANSIKCNETKSGYIESGQDVVFGFISDAEYNQIHFEQVGSTNNVTLKIKYAFLASNDFNFSLCGNGYIIVIFFH